MKRNRMKFYAVSAKTAAVVVCVSILAVGAALDAQVAQQQGGQELDANYRVGAGGRNTAVQSQYIPNSQLYVTGRVTGLGSFRGNIGYFAANRLNLNVPSAALRSFRRASVNVSDVTRGMTYQANPYLDPSTTVFGVREITAGAGVPGGNVARSDASAQTLRRLYSGAVSDYQGMLGGQRLQEGGDVISVQPGPLQMEDYTGPAGVPRQMFTRPGLLPGPGDMMMPGQRTQLMEELKEVAGQTEDTGMDMPAQMPVDYSVPAEVDARILRREEPSDRRGEPDESEAAGEEGMTRGGPLGREPGRAREENLPRANEDVFVDMLMELNRGRETPGEVIPPEMRRRRSEEGVIPPMEPAEEREQPARPGQKKEAEEGGLVERGADDKLIIHGLSGTGKDAYNRYMSTGDKLLKEGRYYAAARRYRFAVSLDSANPVARLGLTLALFNAGEPFTAGHHLKRAMELFPPLMETHLDIADMMDKAAFDSNLEELNARLSGGKKRNPVLLFLASYLNNTSGRQQQAKQLAEMLKKIIGEDKPVGVSQSDGKLYRTFADFILTGERPSAVAETQPTAG